MNRRQAREKALQTLFQLDINDEQLEELLANAGNKTSFYLQLLRGVSTHYEAIDQKIAQNLDHWSIDRIALVEKTVLRIAIYEILYMDEVPKSVSVNEAVEIAKKFGDDQSGKFVNGVLSKII